VRGLRSRAGSLLLVAASLGVLSSVYGDFKLKKSVWIEPSHLTPIRRASAQRPPWYGSFLSQATSYAKQARQRYSPPSKVAPP
jgi:hypothetical protein